MILKIFFNFQKKKSKISKRNISILSIIIFSLFGLPLDEAIGVSLTALDNAGPGLGAQGPAGNFYMLPAAAKWYMSFLMLLGRLELFTILLLFSPSFWKR